MMSNCVCLCKWDYSRTIPVSLIYRWCLKTIDFSSEVANEPKLAAKLSASAVKMAAKGAGKGAANTWEVDKTWPGNSPMSGTSTAGTPNVRVAVCYVVCIMKGNRAC